MNRLFSTLFFITTSFYIIAQCPTPANTMCGMSAGQYDNVVIGEVSGDAGQSDGCNDAIVEIVGPPGTDIGCMVVSDSEWAVLIPPGSTIPADGVFLIACSTDMSSNCGVGINGGSNGLIAGVDPADPTGSQGGGGEGDFNAGLLTEIDLDVCNPANGSFYDPAASGFTLDNSNSTDGEQVMLFLPDGTPHDGIYWGGNGGSGGADHCSVQNGNPYTLGDNDGNGIVNDNAGTVPGGRCDGGNATAVPVLPTDMACGCNTPGSPGTFTMPPLTDPVWYNITPQSATFIGCNSSWVRGGPQTGSHGNPSHMDGQITTAGGVTGDSFTINAFTPSSCGDPDTEWNYTDHPTPGQPNNDPTFLFLASAEAACAVDEEIMFTVEVYNFQNVSNGMVDIMSGVDNIQAGSFVEVNGTQMTYDTYVVNGETTTMTFSFSSWNVGTNTVSLVWDDYTNCCGTSGNPATQSNPNECYETETFTIVVADVLVALDDDIQCPDDNPAGAINLADYVMGGANLMYTLEDNGGTTQGPQSAGAFNLPTGAGPWTATITDGSGCHPDITINIADNCAEEPVCPENFSVDIDGGAGPVEACPGQDVVLCFNGDQLPPGGTITWQYSEDGATFMDIESFSIPAAMPAFDAYISEFIFDPISVPTGCSDGQQWGNTSPEVVEIVATPGANISGYTLSDGEGIFTFPAGFTVPADGVIVICGGACISLPACDITATGGGIGIIFGNSGDEIFFSDPAGNVISAVSYEGGDCTSSGLANCIDGPNNSNDGSVVIDPTGTSYSYSDLDYGGFGTADGPGISSTVSGGYDSTPADMEFCSTFTIPADSCPIGNFTFQAVVDPFDSDNCPVAGESPPDEADATSGTLSVTVSCPDAALDTTPIELCEADASTAMIPITIIGGTGPNYTVEYAINGVTQPSVSIANGGTIDILGPTMGEIKVTLVSIFDEGGALCSGSVNDTEVCVNIRPTETLTITGSANPTSCEPCDGEVTFDISGGGTSSNIFEISYTFNGSSFLLAGVSMPFTISNACPGVYDIESVEDEAGCAMDIVSNEQTLTQPSGDPVSVSGGPGIVCDDGTGTVDLTTDFTYVPAFNATDFAFFSADPNTLPAAALPTAMLPSTTLMPTADQTVWVQYTDTNGCTSVAPLMIDVDPSVCVMPVFDLALTKELNMTATPGPFSPGDPVTYTICVFNQGTVDATNTQVTDYGANSTTNPSGGLNFVGLGTTPATTTQGTAVNITSAGGSTFEIDALAAGEDVCFDVDYMIDPGFSGGSLINDAEITMDSGDDADSVPGDNPTDAPDPDDDSTNDGNDDPTMQDPSDDDYDPAEITVVVCPEIAALTVTGNVCDNNEFTLTTSGLDDAQMMQTSGGGPFQIQYVYYPGAGAAPANPYTTPGTPLGFPVSASGGTAVLTSNNTGLPAGDLTIVAILTPAPTDDTCIPFAVVEVENLNCPADAGRF